jgi:hypothetical protein
MADVDRLVEAEILVDSYGAGSALAALAELAAPACRIEPQLLRRLRIACVPGADVSVEQELWQSELVNSRGATITFREGVARVLRNRLRARRAREPEVVERARAIMVEAHAGLSPLLILEDELAWAEVFDDAAALRAGAQTLIGSLLARRDGLDYWLGRAWNVLPQGLKQLPEGRELGQVAAAKGARVDEDAGGPPADRIVHVLPLAPIPLRLHGLALSVNVPPPEATHVIDAPQTSPRALSITSGSRSEQLVFGVGETKTVHVADGTVVIRTVAGDEYELEASGAVRTAIQIELLPAGHSTCVLIAYPGSGHSHWILVDCGDRKTGRLVVERLAAIPAHEPIELLVLTHIDDGHIGGARHLLDSPDRVSRIGDVWFNTPRQLDAVQGNAI